MSQTFQGREEFCDPLGWLKNQVALCREIIMEEQNKNKTLFLKHEDLHVCSWKTKGYSAPVVQFHEWKVLHSL